MGLRWACTPGGRPVVEGCTPAGSTGGRGKETRVGMPSGLAHPPSPPQAPPPGALPPPSGPTGWDSRALGTSQPNPAGPWELSVNGDAGKEEVVAERALGGVRGGWLHLQGVGWDHATPSRVLET